MDQLQLFYRRSGFPNFRVILPQQTLTDGVVRVEIVNTLPVGVTNVPDGHPRRSSAGLSCRGQRHFAARTTGPAFQLHRTGDLACLHEGLDRLQLMCRQSGFSNLSVTLPQQEFTNGIVRVEIVTSVPAGIAGAPVTAAPRTGCNHEYWTRVENAPATVTNTPPIRRRRLKCAVISSRATLFCRRKNSARFQLHGRVEFARVREGLGKLQLLYRELGFSTISVTLPRQKLTNGIVRVKVVEEGWPKSTWRATAISAPTTFCARCPVWTRTSCSTRNGFQPELDHANANSDRQIYPVISPGLEPGTSDLTLKVKDRLPLHGRLEVNDKSSPGTPLLRLDTAVQYNNLWQLNHQIGLDYNFSPQSMKTDNYLPQFYDQPMVASYSGFYRLPLGFDHGLRETYDRQPVDFGYDEITHTVRSCGHGKSRIDCLCFAFRVRHPRSLRPAVHHLHQHPGEDQFTVRGTQSHLQQQSRHQAHRADPGLFGIHSSFLVGLDYKSYNAPSFGTNLTYFSLYAPDQFGKSGSGDQPNHPASLQQPRFAGLSAALVGLVRLPARPTGVTQFQLEPEYISGRPGLGADQFSSGRHFARPPVAIYTTLNAGLTRRQNLPDDWSLLLRANGQWASEPLINNETIALGGTSGVRGYQEGEVYGDDGWRCCLIVNARRFRWANFLFRAAATAFRLICVAPGLWITGKTYLIDRPAPLSLSYSEWGTGLVFT